MSVSRIWQQYQILWTFNPSRWSFPGFARPVGASSKVYSWCAYCGPLEVRKWR